MAEQKNGLEGYFVTKGSKKLRYGYTTGSCAAAAAKTATWMLLSQKKIEKIDLLTPRGILLHLMPLDVCFDEQQASCAIRKDGGDDPDATDGLLVYAVVSKCGKTKEEQVFIDGGKGVGRITKSGLEQPNQFPPKTNKPGEVALEVENLTAQYSLLRDVSFKVRRGEIVGLAGLDGSGRTETLENIFGIATRKSGTIKLDGKVCTNRNARESIKNGFALLTEERRATGIFGILSIRENTVISSLKKHKKKGLYLSEKSMREDTQWSIDAMHTKTPTQETKIRSLSGGNQQKVILGRWLLTNPEVLLLDEPTRGIDVGAKYEIYQLILDLANKNKVVMVVSSEMPELLGICDRILVMSGGRLAGEVNVSETNQEEIMTLAAKYV